MTSDLDIIRVLVELCVFALLINIPLGVWRVSVRKLSWQWFVSVHLCVPIIFVLRHQAGLSYKYIPVLILCSLSGHFIGGKIGTKLGRMKETNSLVVESTNESQ